MKVIAIKDFTLAGETHAKGEVFEADKMRGEAWRIAGMVREATPEEIADWEMRDEADDPSADDPKVKRMIDEEDDD